MNPLARTALWAYVVVSALQLIGRGAGLDLLGDLTKPLLLPLLMVFVLAQVGWRSFPSVRWLVVGQFFAFLGDAALMAEGDLWFGIGIGMFLVTHICYLVGFFKMGARDALRSRRWVLFAFPAFWIAANAVLMPNLGAMAIPILVYSAFLVAMAMVATSLGTGLGIGGTLFMISDLMIGATVAFGEFAGSGFLIMATYVVGQGLIAWFWLDRVQQPNVSEPRTGVHPGSSAMYP